MLAKIARDYRGSLVTFNELARYLNQISVIYTSKRGHDEIILRSRMQGTRPAGGLEMKISKRLDKRMIYIIIAFVILLIGYYFFLYAQTCKDEQCFLTALKGCSMASYVNSKDTATWQYDIRFSKFSSGFCNVRVNALEIKTDAETSNLLTGKSMMCALPSDTLGSFMPEEKLEYCHGALKEDMQSLMIKRMQEYVINNIGQLK